ncbi:MAG TPA: zinc ribbon domain-containing protein [Gaiellaceae bacterium]|nr:zinc ribbon domain-containing protein [Gaiellaceae bacterium]
MSCFNCGHEISQDARFCDCCGAPQSGARDGPLGVLKAPLLASNQYVRALKRFWWLLVLGLGVATIAALMSVYRIDLFSFPPTVEKKAGTTYTAYSRLLVTSDQAPYLRTRVDNEVTGPDGSVSVYSNSPDISTLITAANLYPILIASDEVLKLRNEMAGPLPGSITSRAIYEVSSPSRFELSQVPVVEVYGHADTSANAVEITKATVAAFLVYVDELQDDAALSRRDRILIQELQTPEGAVGSGGTSLSLPLMLFLVIAAAFVALAILLDRLFPAGLFPAGISLRGLRRGAAAPVEEPERGEAASAAEPERHAQTRSRV